MLPTLGSVAAAAPLPAHLPTLPHAHALLLPQGLTSMDGATLADSNAMLDKAGLPCPQQHCASYRVLILC